VIDPPPQPTGNEGYASKALQNGPGINRVKQVWVMMFPKAKNAPWQGSGKEQHDPEEE
jgi:hypothetical protein